MHTARFRANRVAPRFHWPTRHTGFMTPLPAPPARHRVLPIEPLTKPVTSRGASNQVGLSRTFHQIVVLVLCLLAAMAIVVLLAEVAV